MKMRLIGMVLVAGVLAAAARAGQLPDLSSVLTPGEWVFEASPSVQLGSMPVPERHIKHSMCLTKSDLKKTWFSQNEKNCTIQSVHYANHVLVFTQRCQVASGDITAKGRLVIDSRTAYHGEVNSTGTLNGQALKGHSTIKAHRTGSCKNEEN